MVSFLWENLFKRDSVGRNIVNTLSRNFLFEDLTPSELKFVRDIVHVRTYRPGETVFRQGEVGVGMYIIVSGHVDITVEERNPSGDDKDSIFVTRLEPGDFFGEIALVEDNGRRTATATTHDEVVLIGFFKPDLVQIMSRNPATGVKILNRLAQVLGKRLKETAVKVSELKNELRGLK